MEKLGGVGKERNEEAEGLDWGRRGRRETEKWIGRSGRVSVVLVSVVSSISMCVRVHKCHFQFEL